VSKFLAERGYRWHGTTRQQIPAHDLLADTRRQPDIRPRVRLSWIDRPVQGIPPCRRPITLVHGRLVS
jgi:hypothetical protein